MATDITNLFSILLMYKSGSKYQIVSLRYITFSYIFMAGVFDALTKRSTK